MVPYVNRRYVEWQTDSFAASIIVKKGSNKNELQEFSEKIFDICHKSKIYLSIQWIPRDQLVEVDALSRKIDYDDWETTEIFFNIVCEKWGPFDRDCFADSKNTKTAKFFSKYMCPNTTGVNAFLYSWAQGSNYMVPPVYLVGRTIKQLKFFKGRGVLVVPFWVSASFWIYLCDKENKFKSFVKDYMIFEDPSFCVRQGSNKDCFIGSLGFQSKILALFLDFYTN